MSTDTTPFEEVEDDTPQVSPEEVQQFLNAESESEEKTPEVEESEQEESRITLDRDLTFDSNDKSTFENMFVSLNNTNIKVTEKEKALYLKAMLTMNPVQFEITLKNGAYGVCRTMSVYEGDLVALAVVENTKRYPDLDIMFQAGIVQQYRMALQLVSFCGKAMDMCTYERGVNGTAQEHAQDLYTRSQVLSDLPAPTYGSMVQILNVFQAKINILQEAALNEDFWNPADTD